MNAPIKINMNEMTGATPRWSPEYIEFWAEVYERNRLHRRGLPFVVFLTAPRRELRRIIARDYLQWIRHQQEAAWRTRAQGIPVRNKTDIDRAIDGMVAAAICSIEMHWESRIAEPNLIESSMINRNGTWFQRVKRRFFPRRHKHH